MILRVRDLKKNFTQGGRDIHVLKGVNLTLNKGQTTAIVGNSGSGKSTVLSLLAGLDHPDSGSIAIDGKDISKMSEAELSKFRGEKIGIVFQQFYLMPYLNALDNISLALELRGEKDFKDKALKMLEAVGLKDRATHFPSQLSGGECQRVALARALITEPDLILADEPTGNLDQETAGSVTDLLFKLVRDLGKTLILVTHSSDLANRCDQKFSLSDGVLNGSLNGANDGALN
jgi:putative ABC transport system ATP-binding protein